MASVIASGVSIGLGPTELVGGIALSVTRGRVIGLVGPNGAGKTTLLQALAGLVPPRSGTIERSPRNTAVGYLAQQIDVAADNETIASWLARRTGVGEALKAMEQAANKLGTADSTNGASDLGDRYSDSLESWLALGGADFYDRIPGALAQVGLDVFVEHRVSELSGGQKARVGLAALLLARFDVFCLDEPTNDLDLAGLAQLEQFVAETKAKGGAIVVVSHDRAFLEAVTTDIVELDPVEHRSLVFGGGFGAFLAERAVARRHAQESYDEYRDKFDDLVARAGVTRNWADKGVRASRANLKKKGVDSDKIGRKAKAEASEKQAGKASRLEKAAERLDVVAEPRKVWQLQYAIDAAPRSGASVVTMRQAVLRRGSFTFGPVSVDLSYGDRIAVTGPNGAGKSTLLGLALGHLEPETGSVTRGSGVVLGEVDQARIPADGESTLVDAFLQWYPASTVPEVRTLLAKFGLTGDDVSRPARLLSPGERTRATLARFQHEGVNLLVLDEPTNHLDLPAIEQLEQALASYPGTLVLVSHDRRLLEAVRVTRRWRVEAGRVFDEAV